MSSKQKQAIETIQAHQLHDFVDRLKVETLFISDFERLKGHFSIISERLKNASTDLLRDFTHEWVDFKETEELNKKDLSEEHKLLQNSQIAIMCSV